MEMRYFFYWNKATKLIWLENLTTPNQILYQVINNSQLINLIDLFILKKSKPDAYLKGEACFVHLDAKWPASES